MKFGSTRQSRARGTGWRPGGILPVQIEVLGVQRQPQNSRVKPTRPLVTSIATAKHGVAGHGGIGLASPASRGGIITTSREMTERGQDQGCQKRFTQLDGQGVG